MATSESKLPDVEPVRKLRGRHAWMTRRVIPIGIVVLAIFILQPQNLFNPDWDTNALHGTMVQNLHDQTIWELSLAEGMEPPTCPGATCPLNAGTREQNTNQAAPQMAWRATPKTLSARASTDSWRGHHYSRIETTLPGFAAETGTPVAFDILGIAGKKWRLFVNGIEKAHGNGGLMKEAIVFTSSGGKPGDPLILGFEVEVGRTFIPGIVSLSQPFLSTPAIAPALRAAYRGVDKERVLPDTWARSMLAILVALASMMTPFFMELIVFAGGVMLWNYNILTANDLTFFPSNMKIDYGTLRATVNCAFYACLAAFYPHFFRNRARMAFVPSLMFAALAGASLVAGRFGIIPEVVPLVLKHHYLFFGLTCLFGAALAFNTARATAPLAHARFRSITARIFFVVLAAQSVMALAMQFAAWNWPAFASLNTLTVIFRVAKLNEGNILLFGIVMGLDWALVVRDRQRVLQRFGMVMDPRLMREIIRSPNLPSVKAERVVALFVDLRSFSKMCEEFTPVEVNQALNQYLDVVTQAVQANNGIIDKFVGDAAMALWGVPTACASDPRDSVRAAIAIRRGMKELNARRIADGQPALQFGIGLHCGPAIFGPVGNAQRVDFTAIGPTINLAARLQSLTREREADILLSSDLHELVASQTLVMDTGTANIRGFSKAKHV
ncbi:MAG: hypothetical protein RIQ81_2515, partial [Pseudomonadota bacterium]